MMNNNAELVEAKNTLIGRIFTFVGSGVFLIGSIISLVVGYQTYTRLLATET